MWDIVWNVWGKDLDQGKEGGLKRLGERPSPGQEGVLNVWEKDLDQGKGVLKTLEEGLIQSKWVLNVQAGKKI